MKELSEWVEKNRHRTWHWPSHMKGERLTLEIKYLEFSLDTRDMTVWRLSTAGRGPEVVIRDTKETGDWTILNELEAKLDAAMIAPDDNSGSKNGTD